MGRMSTLMFMHTFRYPGGANRARRFGGFIARYPMFLLIRLNHPLRDPLLVLQTEEYHKMHVYCRALDATLLKRDFSSRSNMEEIFGDRSCTLSTISMSDSLFTELLT